MKMDLTEIEDLLIMRRAGETDAGTAAVQPARDSQTKATNRRGDGRTSAVPFNTRNPRFRAFRCLKKPIAEGKKSSLTGKALCPIPAEPIHCTLIVDSADTLEKVFVFKDVKHFELVSRGWGK